ALYAGRSGEIRPIGASRQRRCIDRLRDPPSGFRCRSWFRPHLFSAAHCLNDSRGAGAATIKLREHKYVFHGSARITARSASVGIESTPQNLRFSRLLPEEPRTSEL